MLCVHGKDSFRMLDRRPNDDITAVRTGNSPTDQNHFLGFPHLEDLKVLHCHSLITEVTGHAHVLPNSAGRRTITNRAVATMRFRTMSRSLAGKVMLFHHPLETFSL